MEEYKCAFSAPLVAGQFGCAHAQHVTRRGGPDVACTVRAAHERCAQLFERLKAVALPAFGVEDDLLSMPHSVLVKIQAGGLLGLLRLQTGAHAETVTDINSLVEQTTRTGIAACPVEQLVGDITGYKLRRRK
jgi:hypothetical protein